MCGSDPFVVLSPDPALFGANVAVFPGTISSQRESRNVLSSYHFANRPLEDAHFDPSPHTCSLSYSRPSKHVALSFNKRLWPALLSHENSPTHVQVCEKNLFCLPENGVKSLSTKLAPRVRSPSSVDEIPLPMPTRGSKMATMVSRILWTNTSVPGGQWEFTALQSNQTGRNNTNSSLHWSPLRHSSNTCDFGQGHRLKGWTKQTTSSG